MDSIQLLARKLLERGDELHPALTARASIAALRAVPISRPYIAPNYGSDLGLRSSTDPRTFSVQSAALVGVSMEPAVDEWDARILEQRWASGSLSERDAAGCMDTLINFVGAWATAAKFTATILESQRTVAEPQLLTYMGTALSAAEDPRAGSVFARCSRGKNTLPVAKAMSAIRLAAWLAKRRSEPQRAAVVLRELRASLRRDEQDRVISPADCATLSGVSMNLEALTAVKRKDYVLAKRLLDEASVLLSVRPLVMVGEDERRRYFAQITINHGQLNVMAGKLELAQAHMETHLAWARENHPASLSEALALTGYVGYLNGDWLNAIQVLREAERMIAGEGAPSRLSMVRKNLAAAHHRNHQSALAERAIKSIEADPTGSDVLLKDSPNAQ